MCFAVVLSMSALGLAGCATSAPSPTPAHAEPSAPVAEVRKAAQLSRLAAPHGKAHVTELARGGSAWLGILELAPGVAVPEHRDPTEETIHLLAGSGTITIDGKVHQVQTGDTIFMPANAQVSYVNGPEPMRAVQVFAGPGPADKYASWTP